jgi:hypothetical protein
MPRKRRNNKQRKGKAPPPTKVRGAKAKVKSSGGETAMAVGDKIGTAIANALSGGTLGSVGGVLGKQAGKLFHKITGLGDYKVTSNTLLKPASMDSLPAFTRAGQATRILHREYIMDVITSATAGAFKIETFPIQPALPLTFPWLANIAANFDEYELNGMIFEFKSNSYDALASTNTASGTVIMTTQYNVLALNFVNKQQMEQYDFTCSSKPSVDLIHPIECARGQTPINVLSTRVQDVKEGDLRLYDFGNFNIATVGMQGSAVNVGELWVSYDVSLYKPRLGVSIYAPVDMWYLGPLDHIAFDTPTASIWGTNPTLDVSSNMGTTLSPAASPTGQQRITFPSSFTGYATIILKYTYSAQPAAPDPSGGEFVWQVGTGVDPTLNFGKPGPYGNVDALSNSGLTMSTTTELLLVGYFKVSGGGILDLACNFHMILDTTFSYAAMWIIGDIVKLPGVTF